MGAYIIVGKHPCMLRVSTSPPGAQSFQESWLPRMSVLTEAGLVPV